MAPRRLKKEKTRLLQILSNMHLLSSTVDGAMITFYAQMVSCNISVIHPGGVWTSSEDITPHIHIVYKGSNEFVPTEPGKFMLCNWCNDHFSAIHGCSSHFKAVTCSQCSSMT